MAKTPQKKKTASKNDSKKSSGEKRLKKWEVATSRKLIKSTLSLIKNNYKVYLIFLLTYGVLLYFFVQGPAAINIGEVQDTIEEVIPEEQNSTTLLAGVLIGESVSIDEAGSVYGFFIVFIFSLALIWLIRAMHDGSKKVVVRDGFYKGMTGLVPVLLVGLVIMLQLLPAAIAGTIYSIASIAGVAVSQAEQIIYLVLFIGFVALSLYFVTSSVIAIFIATLPDVRPIEALRSAKELVKGRRIKVFMRMLTGILVFGAIVFAFFLLSISLFPASASYVWWMFGVFALPLSITYFYELYRSLL